VNRALRGKKVGASELVAGGRAAADATVALMEATVTTLPPVDIIDAFDAVPGRERIDHMWEALKARTVTCVARGALVLAGIWESAWREGGGEKIAAARLETIRPSTLKALYLDRTFVPAVWLKNLTAAELPGLGGRRPAAGGHREGDATRAPPGRPPRGPRAATPPGGRHRRPQPLRHARPA